MTEKKSFKILIVEVPFPITKTKRYRKLKRHLHFRQTATALKVSTSNLRTSTPTPMPPPPKNRRSTNSWCCKKWIKCERKRNCFRPEVKSPKEARIPDRIRRQKPDRWKAENRSSPDRKVRRSRISGISATTVLKRKIRPRIRSGNGNQFSAGEKNYSLPVKSPRAHFRRNPAASASSATSMPLAASASLAAPMPLADSTAKRRRRRKSRRPSECWRWNRKRTVTRCQTSGFGVIKLFTDRYYISMRKLLATLLSLTFCRHLCLLLPLSLTSYSTCYQHDVSSIKHLALFECLIIYLRAPIMNYFTEFYGKYKLRHTGKCCCLTQKYWTRTGNTNWRGRLSTVDLPIKIACFVENKYTNSVSKGADLNYSVQGGKSYRSLTSIRIHWLG